MRACLGSVSVNVPLTLISVIPRRLAGNKTAWRSYQAAYRADAEAGRADVCLWPPACPQQRRARRSGRSMDGGGYVVLAISEIRLIPAGAPGHAQYGRRPVRSVGHA